MLCISFPVRELNLMLAPRRLNLSAKKAWDGGRRNTFNDVSMISSPKFSRINLSIFSLIKGNLERK